MATAIVAGQRRGWTLALASLGAFDLRLLPPIGRLASTNWPAASATWSSSHRATHALVLHAISDVFASGKATGAFDVEDPEATAVLCWASTHGFDPDSDGKACRSTTADQGVGECAAGQTSRRGGGMVSRSDTLCRGTERAKRPSHLDKAALLWTVPSPGQ